MLKCMETQGRRHVFTIGGAIEIYHMLPEAVHRGTSNFSPSFFSYQDGLSWHLRAFALQVPDVRGLQVPGPPCASFLLKFRSRLNVIRTYMGILDCGLVHKPFGFS